MIYTYVYIISYIYDINISYIYIYKWYINISYIYIYKWYIYIYIYDIYIYIWYICIYIYIYDIYVCIILCVCMCITIIVITWTYFGYEEYIYTFCFMAPRQPRRSTRAAPFQFWCHANAASQRNSGAEGAKILWQPVIRLPLHSSHGCLKYVQHHHASLPWKSPCNLVTFP